MYKMYNSSCVQIKIKSYWLLLNIYPSFYFCMNVCTLLITSLCVPRTFEGTGTTYTCINNNNNSSDSALCGVTVAVAVA